MHEGAAKEAEDARAAAECIGISHYSIDLSERFRGKIIRYFTESYQQGETPNPCIVCNPEMKWSTLLYEADALGAERIATGHYAGVVRLENGRLAIRCAASVAKDQAYVLYGLTQEQLSRTVMPLAAYEKEEVRKIAAEIGLLTAEKADSMEVCFLPEGESYTDYIIRTEGVQPPCGNFVDENGRVLGTHQGLLHYTVGQRKGLGIAFGEPYYVKELRPEENEVVLAGNAALFDDTVYAEGFHGMATACGSLLKSVTATRALCVPCTGKETGCAVCLTSRNVPLHRDRQWYFIKRRHFLIRSLCYRVCVRAAG